MKTNNDLSSQIAILQEKHETLMANIVTLQEKEISLNNALMRCVSVLIIIIFLFIYVEKILSAYI